jgi:hypothetical protein
MAIIGNIIKAFVDLKGTITSESNPVEEQKNALNNLLNEAKDTAFGKHYNFQEILNAENPLEKFAQTIPYHNYETMKDKWWNKVIDGQKDITWPGVPDYFALSSGTTGKESKRIPVTDAMVDAIRQAGINQVFALKNFDLPADFFEKEILMLGSSTDLIEKDEHLEGEISGISASNIPGWFSGYYKPGKEIAKIDNWDKRVKKIAEKAKDWDIGALSGIPSWIELMLEAVIKYHNLDTIHDIWPNLQVFTSGGVAFGPYEKSFNKLLGKPILVLDTYLASEGFLAFQERPDTKAMKLITDNGIYFEFVPFKPEYINQDGSIVSDAPSLTIADVELNQDYILIISTVSGAWRYLIGDTIAFTNIERAEIIITGRTKFFLNTVGSQLSVNKLDSAIKHVEEKLDVSITEYTICAKRFGEDFYHSWYLGSDQMDTDNDKIAELIDAYLSEANKNYSVARSKALAGVKVNVVSPKVFHEWSNANKKKGGQVKMERVMSEDKFEEWETFVKNN